MHSTVIKQIKGKKATAEKVMAEAQTIYQDYTNLLVTIYLTQNPDTDVKQLEGAYIEFDEESSEIVVKAKNEL